MSSIEFEDRETKLPVWAQERLVELRKRLENATAFGRHMSDEAARREEEAAAIYDANTTDILYEAGTTRQFLPPNGTVWFQFGTYDIWVSRSGTGTGVLVGADCDQLAVLLESGSGQLSRFRLLPIDLPKEEGH